MPAYCIPQNHPKRHLFIFIFCASSPSYRAYVSFEPQAQAIIRIRSNLLKATIDHHPQLVKKGQEITIPLLAFIYEPFGRVALSMYFFSLISSPPKTPFPFIWASSKHCPSQAASFWQAREPFAFSFPSTFFTFIIHPMIPLHLKAASAAIFPSGELRVFIGFSWRFLAIQLPLPAYF